MDEDKLSDLSWSVQRSALHLISALQRHRLVESKYLCVVVDWRLSSDNVSVLHARTPHGVPTCCFPCRQMATLCSLQRTEGQILFVLCLCVCTCWHWGRGWTAAGQSPPWRHPASPCNSTAARIRPRSYSSASTEAAALNLQYLLAAVQVLPVEV